jgi:acyl transferase domain-containing protein
LQLEHKTLTPLLLHSEQINPDIDFENTPFVINQKTEKWKQPIINEKSYPRRAGISSFGAGGVNVHVIVQEYEGEDIPCYHKRTEAVSFYLIPLSANTEESLKEYVKSLEKFLRHKREEDKNALCLRDIAYTLQIGREPMRFRAAFVVKTKEELIEKLNKCLVSSANDPGINGLFYGQQIEGTEEAFFLHNEKEINRSENILEQRNLNDIAQRWTKGEAFDWTALYLTDKPRLISLPTYPFLKQRYWIVESPNLPDESPQIPPEIPVEQNEDSEYDPKISSAEVSHFLMELAEAPEKEQEAMISNFLQKRIGCLLGFAPDHLPALDLGFFAMGMESMQTLTLQAELEDTFRIKISDTAAFDYPDIKTFSGYLLNLIPFDELEMDESHLPVEQLSSIDKEVSETVMDSQYLYQGPLPDDIMNMDIKEVEKCLNTEMAYFSKKI